MPAGEGATDLGYVSTAPATNAVKKVIDQADLLAFEGE